MKIRWQQKTVGFLTLFLALGLGCAVARMEAGQGQQSSSAPPMQIDDIESRAPGTVISTPDAAVKFRLAGGGFVERTTDGGATWNAQMVSQNARLIVGSASSSKVCWVVGRDAVIALTKNGSDWERIDPPAQADFVAVAAKNDSTATVTTVNGKKYFTNNRGKKWKLVS